MDEIASTVHKQTAGPSEFIDYLKIDLFPDVIYVFTPQGEIIELPEVRLQSTLLTPSIAILEKNVPVLR